MPLSRLGRAEAITIVLNNRKTALDEREAEQDERAQALELAENTRSHKALKAQEAALQAREEVLAQKEKRLAALETSPKDKAAKVKDFANTLHH